MKNNKVSFLLNMASPSVGAIFKLQYYVTLYTMFPSKMQVRDQYNKKLRIIQNGSAFLLIRNYVV